MSDSTLRVRLFEAQLHANALLAFVCLSNGPFPVETQQKGRGLCRL